MLHAVRLRLIDGDVQRGAVVAFGIVVGALAVLALTVVTDTGARYAVPLVALVVGATVGYRHVLTWRTLVSALIVVILFIPIRRYSFPGNLPFELEPYRMLVALIGAGWLASLLADPRVRLRRSGLEGPIGLLVFASLASVLANGSRIGDIGVGPDVSKKVTFFASYLLVFYLFVSLVRTRRDIDFLVRIIVGGCAVLSVFAIVEQVTGYNVFNHLAGVVPLLGNPDIPYSLLHPTGRLRVYTSAEHPIALGAMFVMVVPLAIYVARTASQRRWWLAASLLLLGAIATISRTAVVMLIVAAVVFLVFRPAEVKRVWPAIIPLLLAAHFALPGTLGSLKEAFLPSGGLIAQQQEGGSTKGSGRIADIRPSLSEFAQRPVLGEGLGTRVVDTATPNARILDDQWLSTLLETGAVGAFAWLWLYARFCRRLGREARADPGDRGLLLTALLASVISFAVGMLLFDAFSFVQVTFVLFILLALGVSLTRLEPATNAERALPAGE